MNEDAPRPERKPRFSLFPSVENEADASRLLRRHWGGWVFAVTNALSAATVWMSLPGQAGYAGYEGVAASYFGALAIAAAGLTWMLTRRRKRWAGAVLLALLSIAIIMAFIASLEASSPPAGPYLFLRLWIAVSVINAMRACRSLALVDRTPLPTEAPKLAKGGTDDIVDMPAKGPLGAVAWKSGLRRVAILYAVVGTLAVAWTLLGEEWWLAPCPKTYTVGGYVDADEERAYERRLAAQFASGCWVRNPNTIRQNEIRRQLGIAEVPICGPVAPPLRIPEQTITRSQNEVMACTWEASRSRMEYSEGLSLAVRLILLPAILFGLFMVGQWLWRGFKPNNL
jgi:hypothetical protein